MWKGKKMKTTIIDRQNTNEEVFRRASEAANKQIIPIDEYLQEKAIRLLGHLFKRRPR